MASKKPALFAICESCGGKFAHDDGHKECMHCLYRRGHDTARCKICRAMTPRRRHDRDMKVKARLAEESLFGHHSTEDSHREEQRSRSTGPRASATMTEDSPRGTSPTLMPPPTLKPTPRQTTESPSKERSTTKERNPSEIKSTSRERHSSTSRSPSSSRGRSTSRDSRSSTSTSTSERSTSKKKREHSTHLPRKKHRREEDRGLPAEESEAELYTPNLGADLPESILQDTEETEGEGLEGALTHLTGPEPALHGHAEALTRMQDSLQSIRAMMTKRDRDWQRQQDALVARLRQEEEDRRVAREAKETQLEARRAQELEALVRSMREEGLKAPTPAPTPPPSQPPRQKPTRTRVLCEEEDEDPESSDEEGGRDPLDKEDPEPRGEAPDPLDAPVPEAQPDSPPDDQAQFCALIQRAAANFGIQTQKEVGQRSILMDKMTTPMKQVTQLPTDSLILRKAATIFSKPASATASNPRQEKKYQVPDTDPLYLRGMPPADSIVATAARKRSSSSSLSAQAGPPEKEHRKLDTVGKKVCTAASLAIREANSIAIVSRYTRDLWDTMEGYLRFVPEEFRQAAANTVMEGKIAANHGVKMALDVADASAHSMAHGVALRRHGWLQGSGFKADIQHRLLDMPFDGQQLFGKEVEDSISKAKGELETMKGVPGLQQQQPQSHRKKDFRNQGQKHPQHKKTDKTWPSTSRGGHGGARGNGKRGRGGSNSRGPPKDKA